MEFSATAPSPDAEAELRAAEHTCSVLVEVFRFSPQRARQAVDNIMDKSDVELAWNWLLDHGEDDAGGPVVPTQMYAPPSAVTASLMNLPRLQVLPCAGDRRSVR